jgi:hypothetical protein
MLKVIIPAIIDLGRCDDVRLYQDRLETKPFELNEIPSLDILAFLANQRINNNRLINNNSTPLLSVKQIESIILELKICNDLGENNIINEIKSGNFITSEKLKTRNIDEKYFIINILDLVFNNSAFQKQYYSFIKNENDLKKFAERITLFDVQEFWTVMLKYEISYLARGINGLGFWEWNNFGLDIYNSLARSNNKSMLFNEVNKILQFILYPYKKSQIILHFNDKISHVKTVEFYNNQFANFQIFLDFIYKTYLSNIVPRNSYEKKWIIEHNGSFIRKIHNNDLISMDEIGIIEGAILNLFLLKFP